MTTTKAMLTLLLIPMFLSFSGCLDEVVRTTVAPDGSSVRTISAKLPTRHVPEKLFPAPTDSTWSVEWKELVEKDAKYEFVARKAFRTPEELERERSASPDSGVMGLSVSLERRFAWFFTYFDYEESYTYRNPFPDVPVSRYLTSEEIERFQRDAEDETLKDKAQRWYLRTQFEFVYGRLVAEARRRADPALSEKLLLEKRDECFGTLVLTDSLNHAVAGSGKRPSGTGIQSAHDLLRLFADVLGSDAVLGLEPAAAAALEEIERKEEAMKLPDRWAYAVQLPGLLLNTNSDVVEGSTASWKFSPDQVHVGTYVMRASSRIHNVWAFVVTGLALLLLALVGARPGLRRRR